MSHKNSLPTPQTDKYEFIGFPKVGRLSRECVISEKIDGTNAQIMMRETSGSTPEGALARLGNLVVWAGSRKRWLSVSEDNFNFATWVLAHVEELLSLGEGRHFGEWWGSGIQRGYNLKCGEKRFSLFNTLRWSETSPPPCCSLVPVLYQGIFTTEACEEALTYLRENGSVASPGFLNPEGVVIYHTASKVCFKKTLENDSRPKSLV